MLSYTTNREMKTTQKKKDPLFYTLIFFPAQQQKKGINKRIVD